MGGFEWCCFMWFYSFVIRDIFCDSLWGWTDNIACIFIIYECIYLFVGYVCSTNTHMQSIIIKPTPAEFPADDRFNKKKKLGGRSEWEVW